MIETILWDFDGVIAESVDVKGEAFREMYLKYGVDIADKVLAHHMENGGVSRYDKFKEWHEIFLGKALTKDEIDTLANEFSNLVVDKVIAAPLIPGILDFLKANHNSINFYVISATPDKEIKEIVKKMNLSSYFKGVMGSPTSKSQWVDKLRQDIEMNSETTLFVGDSTSDYKAATVSKLKFVLREVEYNKETFKDYKGLRVENFIDFNDFILNI
jgi:phosphoglycolate phosphatase-like HAD superfamily hydrolase